MHFVALFWLYWIVFLCRLVFLSGNNEEPFPANISS